MVFLWEMRTKSVKKLKSGDFLIETLSSSQTKSFLNAKTLLDIPISVTPHKSLNSVRGVISEPDLLNTSDSDILEAVPSFAKIVQQKKPIDTVEKFTQTDSDVTYVSLKKSVSTLTDDKICNVTRPPKKKKAQQDTSIHSNGNSANSNNVDFHTHLRATIKLTYKKQCNRQLLITQCPESMLTDNLLPDVQDAAESEDYIDYDPEESIDEDFIDDHHRREPSTSRTVANSKFYPALNRSL
ncbi:hypothetical protein HNY73_006746 [Argiope bruennichi]|uniref:Uncharacterized protein n=1 Tax=Argiope bruennichi TaxID=94029 RepID=A0A8T0FHD1_ARGBR|nr:hypothetical protein HNY73_006746 [Argiope bruennichi]